MSWDWMKYLVERWHRGRGHNKCNTDDRVAVETISVGHHYDARDGQDSSNDLQRGGERDRGGGMIGDGWMDGLHKDAEPFTAGTHDLHSSYPPQNRELFKTRAVGGVVDERVLLYSQHLRDMLKNWQFCKSAIWKCINTMHFSINHTDLNCFTPLLWRRVFLTSFLQLRILPCEEKTKPCSAYVLYWSAH